MIGPGWLPTRPRCVGLRRRPLPSPRPRPRRKPRGTSPRPPVDLGFLRFDRGYELPRATLRKAPGIHALFLGDLHRWILARWMWLRPRTVPVLFAALGALALVQAVTYLSNPPLVGNAPTLTLTVALDAP